MLSLQKGRFHARMAATAEDLRAAQRLRWLCFVGKRGGAGGPDQLDCDDLDLLCGHVLVEDVQSGTIVACFRLMLLPDGKGIETTYAAKHYNLSQLSSFDGPMIEIGRFCIHPEWPDPDILRVAWGALTQVVDQHGVKLLFGCASFIGTDTIGYEDSFAMLRERHLAPKRWLPRVKAPDVFRFARLLRRRKPDPKQAMALMPPLLRTYLMMGGWVSDHAVVDRQLNTLHVFTGVEVTAIPPGRARLLRGVAGPA